MQYTEIVAANEIFAKYSIYPVGWLKKVSNVDLCGT